MDLAEDFSGNGNVVLGGVGCVGFFGSQKTSPYCNCILAGKFRQLDKLSVFLSGVLQCLRGSNRKESHVDNTRVIPLYVQDSQCRQGHPNSAG